MAGSPVDATILDRLSAVIESRRGADPERSYTAQLLQGGTEAILKKIDEESAETVAAARTGSGPEIAAESADLLYHLLVLWAERGIAPTAVWAELARREGTSGVEEKRARKK